MLSVHTLSRGAAVLCAVWLLAVGAATSATTAYAQPRPDSVETLRRETSQSERFQFGTLLQSVTHFSGDPAATEEGFQIANARLSVEGQVTSRLTYELEVDFAEGAELKDARIGYRVLPRLSLSAGQFKAPFSYSALTSTAETPFVRRPRVVDALGLGRQVGLMLRYRPRSGPVVLRGGVFDGTSASSDPNGAPGENPLLFAGRIAWRTSGPRFQASIGANAAYDATERDVTDHDASEDGAVPRSGFRYGADVHLERGGAFVTAEALAYEAPDQEAVESEPASEFVSSGLYLTAGYSVTSLHRLRVQLDRVTTQPVTTGGEAAADAADPASTLLGVGYTFAPSIPLRLEVDYLVPLASPGIQHSSVLMNLQVSL